MKFEFRVHEVESKLALHENIGLARIEEKQVTRALLKICSNPKSKFRPNAELIIESADPSMAEYTLGKVFEIEIKSAE